MQQAATPVNNQCFVAFAPRKISTTYTPSIQKDLMSGKVMHKQVSLP